MKTLNNSIFLTILITSLFITGFVSADIVDPIPFNQNRREQNIRPIYDDEEITPEQARKIPPANDYKAETLFVLSTLAVVGLCGVLYIHFKKQKDKTPQE